MTRALRKTYGREQFLPDGRASAKAATAQIWSTPPALTDEALARMSAKVTARLAETAEADRKALREEAAAVRWERSEASGDSDPYF
jgi:hypothetical protein